MSRTITILLKSDPQHVFLHVQDAAKRNGLTLQGNSTAGSFSGTGIRGHYQIEGQNLVVTVTKKPIYASWSLVESKLSAFFAEADRVEIRPNPPRQAQPITQGLSIMNQELQAEKIIRNHVLWAMGGGLIPVPLADLAAVTAVQLDMLEQLATLYEIDVSESAGKSFVSALTGGAIARIGASFIKTLPGVGTVIGGVAMSMTSGASTYGVGQVVAGQFSQNKKLEDIDLTEAKAMYQASYERGKDVVAAMQADEEMEDIEIDVVEVSVGETGADSASEDTFEKLEKLGVLRDSGVVSAEEFEAKKKELLALI